MPKVLKKSSSGASFSRGTLKWAAARLRISFSVWSVLISHSRQVWLRVFTFDKFAQPGFDRRAGEQFAENVDLALKLVIGYRLDECLGGGRGLAVELAELHGGCVRHAQRLAFA